MKQELMGLTKKRHHISVKLGVDEKRKLTEFCTKNDLTISNFLRYAIKKTINEETDKNKKRQKTA